MDDITHMTHCQIRPIFTFKFSIFYFFSEVKRFFLKWSFLDFIIFPWYLWTIWIKYIFFNNHKNTHFFKMIIQILYKKPKSHSGPLLSMQSLHNCPENWALLLLPKVSISISMGQNLYGKIICLRFFSKREKMGGGNQKWENWMFAIFLFFEKNFKPNIYNTFFLYFKIFPSRFCPIETKNCNF